MDSVLNKKVSYFPKNSETEKGFEVNLLQLLKTDKHKAIIKRLRAETDKVRQKAIKGALPCYTVPGVFKERTKAGLIIPSQLACVDLDEAEQYDVLALSLELRKLPYIAYCGLSCRGQRLFLIIPFATSDYDKHYARLIQSFTDMRLPMGDQCHKTISQPRYVSYNDETTHWLNHSAKPYSLLPKKPTYHIPRKPTNQLKEPDNAFNWCVVQIDKSHQFKEGMRHPYIIALARYCNLKGIPEDTTLDGCLNFVRAGFDKAEIQSIVKHVYTNHTDSYNKLPFNTINPQARPFTSQTNLSLPTLLIQVSCVTAEGTT